MTDVLDTREADSMTTVGEDPEYHEVLRRPSSTTSDGDARPDFPQPPERGSFDDDDLVRAVDRHLDDTATVDLIGILQAQMVMRAAEAARFADWEEKMRRLGTDEAMAAVEKTRMRFTGVIPVITPEMAALARTAPVSAETLEPVRPVVASGIVSTPAPESAPVAQSVPDASAAPADQLVVTPAASTTTTVPSVSRAFAIGATVVAVLLVAAAVVAALVARGTGVAAVLAVVGVIGAAWLGIVLGRLGLHRGSTAATPTAVIVALVAAVVVGEGFVRSTERGFTWTGYLLRALNVTGLDATAAVAAGLAAAIVLGFAIVVLIARIGAAKRPE